MTERLVNLVRLDLLESLDPLGPQEREDPMV